MSEQISVQSLHKKLNEKGYICDVNFVSRVATSVLAKPTGGAFLYGPAGTGKSYLPQVLSEVLKRKMFFHQCSAGTREDDLLMRIFPSEDTHSGVEIVYGKVHQAVIASKTEKVILVLDEWDKTRPSADGYMLDFLQYGRLSVPGEEVNANLDNMIIFLHPKLVRKALQNTHDGHINIPNAISLYQRCLIADMPKPATIQELRQLLDAINFLGKGSDWNELVYQYITKTAENHELLVEAEGKDIDNFFASGNSIRVINSSAYENVSDDEKEVDNARQMPGLFNLHEIDRTIDNSGELPDGKNIYGIFENNHSSYDASVRMTRKLTDDPQFPEWSGVIGDKIIINKPIDVHEYRSIINMTDGNRGVDSLDGEVMFRYKECTREEARRLVFRKYEVHKSSKSEIIARFYNHEGGKNSKHVDLRWTQEDGLSIIVPIGENGISTSNIHGLFKLNRHLGIIGDHNGETRNFQMEIDSSKVTSYMMSFAAQDYDVESLGTAMIKELSNHDGFCDISISRCRLNGVDSSANSNLNRRPSSLIKDLNFSSSSGIVNMSSSGIELEIGDDNGADVYGHVKLKITSLPNINLFYFALRGLIKIPLYACFKANAKDVTRKLSKSGWSMRRKVMVSPCGKFKMIESFGYICFMRIFSESRYDSSDLIFLKSDVKNALAELRKLRRRFEQD